MLYNLKTMKKYISVTEAQKNLSSIIDDVQNNGAVYAITRYERSVAVMMRTDAARKMALYRTELSLRKLYKQIAAVFKEFY